MPWDPNNDYHYPWQSGHDRRRLQREDADRERIAEPTKIADLWTIPADKMTFLDRGARHLRARAAQARHRPGSGEGRPPTTSRRSPTTSSRWSTAGLRFTGNEYLQDFGQKKVWAAMVWSGDLASSGGEDDKLQSSPRRATMIWTDNMLIPKGAANKYTAELMIDYVYDPKIAAQIADYVYYVSPVKGADDEIKALDPDAATNPLLFPPPDVVAKQHNFQFLSDELEDEDERPLRHPVGHVSRRLAGELR